jgi:solute carrier family 40 (iron-regulated transporter), member 1
MTFSEHYVGTIVVSAWNIISMVAEYFILHSIYKTYPRLAIKQAKISTTGDKVQKRPLIRKVFRSCFTIVDGWHIYFRNRVAPAGLALACLFFTVMAFGGVTNTYIRTQGLSESVISIMMAVGAVTGIAGTFVFPRARGKIGLERTGLFALSAQLFFLVFCVMSVWLPGSPFDLSFFEQMKNETWMDLAAEKDKNLTDIDSGKWITRPVAELPSVIVFMFGMIGARFG